MQDAPLPYPTTLQTFLHYHGTQCTFRYTPIYPGIYRGHVRIKYVGTHGVDLFKLIRVAEREKTGVSRGDTWKRFWITGATTGWFVATGVVFGIAPCAIVGSWILTSLT
jgi:hypothetical protein